MTTSFFTFALLYAYLISGLLASKRTFSAFEMNQNGVDAQDKHKKMMLRKREATPPEAGNRLGCKRIFSIFEAGQDGLDTQGDFKKAMHEKKQVVPAKNRKRKAADADLVFEIEETRPEKIQVFPDLVNQFSGMALDIPDAQFDLEGFIFDMGALNLGIEQPIVAEEAQTVSNEDTFGPTTFSGCYKQWEFLDYQNSLDGSEDGQIYKIIERAEEFFGFNAAPMLLLRAFQVENLRSLFLCFSRACEFQILGAVQRILEVKEGALVHETLDLFLDCITSYRCSLPVADALLYSQHRLFPDLLERFFSKLETPFYEDYLVHLVSDRKVSTEDIKVALRFGEMTDVILCTALKIKRAPCVIKQILQELPSCTTSAVILGCRTECDYGILNLLLDKCDVPQLKYALPKFLEFRRCKEAANSITSNLS